jgi:hypothetical protein
MKMMIATASIQEPPTQMGRVGLFPTREPEKIGLMASAAELTEARIPRASPWVFAVAALETMVMQVGEMNPKKKQRAKIRGQSHNGDGMAIMAKIEKAVSRFPPKKRVSGL